LLVLARGATERTLRTGVARRSNVLSSALVVAALHIVGSSRAEARFKSSAGVAAPVLEL
jgi:hypothetical protein